MGFQISTEREFSAAHALRLHDGRMETLHGHNWRVRVTVSAARLSEMGVVMDFHELERLVDAVIGAWHNANLNEAPAFARLNPSAENVAKTIADSLALPGGLRLQSVEVWETAGNCARYEP